MTTLTNISSDIATGIAKIQSPYLYLQAAGSDGSDGSVDGIHLRWDFLGSLGEHLPKGNLAAGPHAPYPAAYGFNKANDFVEIMRVPYVFQYPATVNFNTDRPASVVETGPTRLWKFHTVVRSALNGTHCDVVIQFDDASQYDKIRAKLNPKVSPGNFLAQYKGILEASVAGKLSFALTFSVKTSGNLPYLRIEAISTPDNIAGADPFISCRKIFGSNPDKRETTAGFAKPPKPVADDTAEFFPLKGKTENRVTAENIAYFRFDYSQCVPVEIKLETYEQFIQGSANQQEKSGEWRPVGKGFSLSDDDKIVYNRLEDLAKQNVNHKWPRYLGADETSGLFTVNVQNYKAKWNPTLPPLNEANDINGFKQGVIGYLRLSQQPSNPAATTALQNADPADQSMFTISYFQMLKIIALDYHAARMLGLGYIDHSPFADDNNSVYVYLAIYHTVAALETGSVPAPFTHFYMTLPTSRSDSRLPPPPIQEDPYFGISLDNGTSYPIQLTDANGYTPFDDVRIINLNIKPFDIYQPFGPFFYSSTQFCSKDITKPVFYGIKYKLATEAAYRAPELSYDSEFSDASGIFETAPVIPQLAADENSPAPPLFVHEERENGNHEYGIFGINLFSRSSALSNIKTVNTLIPIRNTLLAPANFAVQLIQPEDPQILTTVTEQTMLASLTGDQTLVRLTFDWNQNHYIAQRFSPLNNYADKVQIFFRQEPPRTVQGKIKSVNPVPYTQFADVRTEPYVNISSSPQQIITPAVVPGDEPRFVGSFFASGQVLYLVESVTQSAITGEGPVFRINKQVSSTVSELNNTNQFSASVDEMVPNAGDRFLLGENMSNISNWSAPLAKEVEIVNFLVNGQSHTETITNPDGTQKIENIGGIYETATVTELPDLDETGQAIPNSRTGIYELEFDTFQLAIHPDTDVSWYKGTVRIPENINFLPTPADPARSAPRTKVLDVWKIDRTSGNALKLTVYDATLDVDNNYLPQNGYCPIASGTGIAVNFHPGYRLYLKSQTTVFDEGTIYPGINEPARQTFMSSLSKNTMISVASFLTPPVVLQSRKITNPVPPGLPIGPLYATRPNFYGKSTWTMDVPVTVNAVREPYALVFYRANERAILDALYNSATADGIVEIIKLLPPDDAAFETNRWTDLVNVQNLDTTDGGFKAYTAEGYRFPNPDKHDYLIPGTAIHPFDGSLTSFAPPPGNGYTFILPNGVSLSMTDVVKQCIQEAFVPLTEVPVIYQFIKPGTQTSSQKPVTRNANGDMFAFTDPQFDPAPMVVKYLNNGNTFVRFTDFSLDGTLINSYFYYAVEMNNEMKFGTASPVFGPVRLVNAYPAEQPGIRKLTALLEDTVAGILPAISLEINPYIESENIKQVKLYRATNSADATSVRTMTLVDTFDVVSSNVIKVADTFTHLPFPLFGDPLFYRVVTLREILNEFGMQEHIPSKASDLGMALLADVINPPPPEITPVIGNTTSTELQNVKLNWGVVAYNATYYLYQMTASGNWQSIFQIKTNDQSQLHYLLPSSLIKVDEDGNTLYYRFKIKVENASGLFNLNDKELTL